MWESEQGDRDDLDCVQCPGSGCPSEQLHLALPEVFLCESVNNPLLLIPVILSLAAHYTLMLQPLTWGL